GPVSQQPLIAPLEAGQRVATLRVSHDGKPLTEYPVVALESVAVAGFFARAWDSVRLWFKWGRAHDSSQRRVHADRAGEDLGARSRFHFRGRCLRGDPGVFPAAVPPRGAPGPAPGEPRRDSTRQPASALEVDRARGKNRRGKSLG